MSLALLAEKDHEEIVFFRDPKTSIVAIVAIHSTVLGPALGGTRMMSYGNLDEALTDVLRLSEGMSYKNSLAGLRLGGGKAVIVADRKLQAGRSELFEQFGRFVESLNGRYITAEDLGTSVEDMNSVLRRTSHVTGRDQAKGGGGDPSPYTALGVLGGMKAACEYVWNSPELKGRHVAIQGVGHVGMELCRLLAERGARISVCDSRPEALEQAKNRYGAAIVSVQDVYQLDCDIFAPCATGGIINPETAPKLNCKIVAGAANNQIAGGQLTPGSAFINAEVVEESLARKGIVYAPDFAINSGGVILCYDELEPGGYTPARVLKRVSGIEGTIKRILEESRTSGQTPAKIAVRLAKDRIASGK